MHEEGRKPDEDFSDAPRQATRRRRRESGRLLRAESAYVAGLAAFAVLAVLAHVYAYFVWDLSLARALQSIDFPGWAVLMKRVSYFGNGWKPWILTTTTALLFFIWRRRSECFGLILSAGGGAVINNVFKLLVGRPRPSAELVGFSYASHETSFPSGHVTFYVCYFGFLFFVAHTLLVRARASRVVILALTSAAIVLVGISRVYLRAHWPSDVIGAYLLSGTWLVFSLETYRRWKRRATLHPEEQAASVSSDD